MRKIAKRLSMFACATAIGSIALGGSTLSSSAMAADLEFQTYGTYAEYAARYWQWVIGIPADRNPLVDATGENCTEGQFDDVWFLAGSFGGTVVRKCTIPQGKRIFFPIINSVVFGATGQHKDTQNTYNDLRETAAVIPDSAEDLVCEVDEVPCEYHRARSPLFTIIAKPGALAAPGQFTKPGQSDNAVSDGHWALLEPLPLGKHEIHFSSETSGFFYVDITYNVTIVAEQ